MAKTPNSDAPNDETPDQSLKPDAPNDEPSNGGDNSIRPTEQIPTEPKPVSARAAASGGATGLGGKRPSGRTAANAPADPEPDVGVDTAATSSADATPRENENVFRRHPLAAGITVGVIAVVLVSGLTAWGVGSAVTASLTSSNSSTQLAPVPSASPAPATGARGKLAGGRLAFRATIQSINDSSWTILTKKGKTVTVTVDGSTQFGTKRMSETAGSFAVGDSVIVVATMTGGTATATRVVNASDVGKGAAANGGTGSGSGDMAPMPTPTPTAST